MDLLLSQAFDSNFSDNDSFKGVLDNLNVAPDVASNTISTVNLEEDNAEDIFSNEVGISVASQNSPGEVTANSLDTVLVKYSPEEVDILTKLEETTLSLFPPDNAKVYIKEELCEALRAHGQSAGFAISTESSSFHCTRAWEIKGCQTQHSKSAISQIKHCAHRLAQK
jgi:hypothetical protein